MLIVGITGGIGSGKSLVSRIFGVLGVPVFNSDEVGRMLLDTDKEVTEKVIRLFGNTILNAEGSISKPNIAAVVFKNKEKLNKLNAIIHPAVQSCFEKWIQENKSESMVLKETAILFESGTYKQCAKIITVTAPENIRIQRVAQRDNISEDKVKERMKNQMPDEEKIRRSDFVILNNEQQLLIPQVIDVYHHLNQ